MAVTTFTVNDFKPIPVGIQSCEMLEGPYYFKSPIRRDIRDEIDGLALKMGFRVVHYQTGAPLENATVEIWHCNPDGFYSGYPNVDPNIPPNMPMNYYPEDDEIFLRGRQKSDAEGLVEFRTIFPGWYASRAPHIHVKVCIGIKNVLTSQAFFPEEAIELIFGQEAYLKPDRPARDDDNANDMVLWLAKEKAQYAIAEITPTADGYAATLTLAVDPEVLSNPQFPDLSPEIFEAMPSHIGVWRKHSPSLKELYQKILEREGKA